MKKFVRGLAGLTLALGLFIVSESSTEARGYSHFDAPPFDTYKVFEGDSFYYIGLRYGVSHQELMRINHDVDPYNMQVGSRIKLVDKQSNQNNENASFANSDELQVFELVNKERAERGLSTLKLDDEVSKVARAKSQDMIDHQYFSHTSPTYGSPFDMLDQYGVSYRGAAENIAAGQQTPEDVMNSWMNSSGHRQNILNESHTHVGIGYANGDSQYGHYWTQMFISK